MFLPFFTLLAFSAAPASPMKTSGLRCEYQANPLGMDETAPRLSWMLEDRRRGEIQSAYQIIAADNEADLNANRGTLWDSGKIASDQSTQVVYGGKPLESGEKVWWKVKVWDKEGQPASFSPASNWEMGLLSPGDWKAQWISGFGDSTKLAPSPLLRKTFRIDRTLKQARLYATALGVYTCTINGKRIGNDYFTPGWTDYKKRVQYQTYDVTKQVKAGGNAIGFVLGDGWYCGNVGFGGRRNHYGSATSMRAQLQLTYSDNTTETVVTDPTWKTGTGPIETSDLLMGEIYDARKELENWTSAKFDDSAWKNALATPVSSLPANSKLVAQYSPTVQKAVELRSKKVWEKDGKYIFDLGQNMVGWARLKVKGAAGTKITLRFAEILDQKGSVYTTNLREARATDVYILKGGKEESYEPSFTFHGFRYVELSGFPGKPKAGAVTGIVLHSASPQSGSFECSSPMVNQLQHNIQWGQRGNYFEVPTDCPQRDERLGWMGDAQIFIRTGCFNEDVSAFMTKWVQDVVDAQSPAGGFSDVSPRIVDPSDGAPAWGDAGIIVPYTLYQCYGDKRIIEKHFGAMAKWIEYIRSANPNMLWRNRGNNNFGDWLNIGADTPRDVLGTSYFAYDTLLMSRMAHALGKTEDEKTYTDMYDRIKEAYNKEFVAENGRIRGNTQTCYVLALRFGLLPEAKRALAAQYLVEDIKKRDWHLSTGFVGVGYLTPTLTQTGNLDTAYKLLNQDTFPSWGYCIKQGATTIWERWDGYTAEKGFQDPGMNSFNHYSLGSVGEWLYTDVGGIDLDPANPGYKHILIHPKKGGGLTYAKAAYLSHYGNIASSWKEDATGTEYDVTIPVNTSATVFIPAESVDSVVEGATRASAAAGVRFLRMEAGCAVYEVGSGSYKFHTR